MFANTVSFANLLLAALTAGAMFGVWLGMDPRGLSAAVYVAEQQHLIRGMNVAMPVLGGVTVILTIVSAVLARADRTRLTLLVASAACFVVAGLITRLLNQPINAVVMTWSAQAPPGDWSQLRDQWWRWHLVRTGSALTGLCLLIGAMLRTSSCAGVFDARSG